MGRRYVSSSLATIDVVQYNNISTRTTITQSLWVTALSTSAQGKLRVLISSSEIGYRRVHEWNECTLVSYWIEEIITSNFSSTSELVRLQLWPQWSRLRGDGAVTWYEIVYYGFVCAYRMWSTKQHHQAIDVLKCTPQKNEYCNTYLHTKVSIRLSILSQSSTTVTALVQVICTGAVTLHIVFSTLAMCVTEHYWADIFREFIETVEEIDIGKCIWYVPKQL